MTAEQYAALARAASSPLYLWRTVGRELPEGVITPTGSFTCWAYYPDRTAIRLEYRYPERTASLSVADTNGVFRHELLHYQDIPRFLLRELRLAILRHRNYYASNFRYSVKNGVLIPRN